MVRKEIPKDLRVTHYSDDFVKQMTNTETLYNSLAVGSKKRLVDYQRNLALSRGLEAPNFDDKVISLVKKYAIDKESVSSELQYLDKLTDPEGYKFSRNLKVYNTTEEAMFRFSQPDYTSFRWNRNYQMSLERLKSEFRTYNLKSLSYTNDDDVREALPKTDTHSGYYYILSGNKKKGENMDNIYNIYAERKKIALEQGSFNNPILIGFRTQASGEYDDDGNRTNTCKHKLRVVSMFDLINIIAELTFAKPIQRRMSQEWYYAGGKDEHEIASIINTWRTKYDRFLSIDYSSYDQTISSWLIEDAFSVIREAFPNLSDEESSLFDVIVHDFIHKEFIVNEGIVSSHRGVPSGSMFTQIIDTIVNLLVGYTYFISIGAKAEMIAMGDDNCIFTNSETSLGDLASYIIKNFGLIVKTDDKSNEGNAKLNDVKFLSRYWRTDGQWRHPYQLLSRLAYPERWRNYNDEVGPEHVIFAFILTYRLGMERLINIPLFMRENPISRKFVEETVDSRYLPGAMAYIKEYNSAV